MGNMGSCCGGDERTRNIEVAMRNQKQVEDQQKKILLLGSGASGKSTLFKQVKDINPSQEELEKQRTEKESAKEEAKNVIRMNLIAEMATLIARGIMYHHDNPDAFTAVCYIFPLFQILIFLFIFIFIFFVFVFVFVVIIITIILLLLLLLLLPFEANIS